MATKNRHPIVKASDSRIDSGVAKWAKIWGFNETETKKELINYALNRLDTLARYAEKRPAKTKKERKPKAVKPKKEGKTKIVTSHSVKHGTREHVVPA